MNNNAKLQDGLIPLTNASLVYVYFKLVVL